MRRLGWLGVGLLYAALAVGGWAGGLLAVAGLAAIGGAVYTEDAGFTLLGPLARWELVRAARRPKLYLWRTAAAGAVAGVVGVSLLNPGLRIDGTHAAYARAASNAVTAVGLGVVGVSALFCLFQLSAVIAEEREQNRLDHLLVTDLRDHEILLGKVAGRLAVLLMYAAAGLPVLAAVTVYGGVSPDQVLVGGVAFTGGLAVLAALCVFASTCAYQTYGGVAFACLLTLLVVGGLGGAVSVVHVSKPTPLRMVQTQTERTLVDAVAPVLAVPVPGNPIYFVEQLREADAADEWEARGGELLRGFAACVLVLTAGFWWGARWHLRNVGMKPPAAGPKQQRWGDRRPVDDDPVYWQAVHASDGWLGRLIGGQWWAAGVLVGLFLVVAVVIEVPGPSVEHRLRLLIPLSGPALFLTVTVPTGYVAARAIAGERDRGTLEPLLLTDLSPAEIIRQKWWAVVLSVRGRCAAAVTACGFGLLAGGSVWGVAAVGLTTAVNVALAASLGLIFSVHSRTANRACLWYTVAVGGYVGFFGLSAVCGGSGPGGQGGAFLFLLFLLPAIQLPAGLVGADGSDGYEDIVVCCGVVFAVPILAALASGLYRTAQSEFALILQPVRERERSST